MDGAMHYEKEDTRRMPSDLEQIVGSVFRQALRIVADEGEMMPVGFVICFSEKKKILPVGVPFTNPEQKHACMMMLRMIAEKEQADCVVFMCEAWGKSTTKQDDVERIQKKGGRVSDEPDAFECLAVNVETYNGIWLAMPKLVVKGKLRSYEPPQFRFADGVAGTMTGLLPPRGPLQ